MCFIVVGYFNKIEKKKKKSYTPLTSKEATFLFNEVLRNSGLIETFKMINECANSPSLSNRMFEDEIKNRKF